MNTCTQRSSLEHYTVPKINLITSSVSGSCGCIVGKHVLKSAKTMSPCPLQRGLLNPCTGMLSPLGTAVRYSPRGDCAEL